MQLKEESLKQRYIDWKEKKEVQCKKYNSTKRI